MEWSFRVFLNFFSGGIMEKNGRSEKYFISCAFAGVSDPKPHMK